MVRLAHAVWITSRSAVPFSFGMARVRCSFALEVANGTLAATDMNRLEHRDERQEACLTLVRGDSKLFGVGWWNWMAFTIREEG